MVPVVPDVDGLSQASASSYLLSIEPDASAPTETALFSVYNLCDGAADQTGCDHSFVIYWMVSYPINILNRCTAPTITSVTPSGWWAGEQQDITITGNCFLTLSDAGGPSKVTVTDGANAVTLSNVSVVSSTQITATVNVTKKAPAETVTLTVTNPSSSGTQQSATASPAPVVLPVPVIKWNGRTISGDSAKNQSVIVGQPVELTTTPATLPGGFTISNSTWDIDGTTIKQYHEDDDDGISVDETDLEHANTSFYWLYPDSGLNVTYTYCATDTNGNQICTSPQAKAAFKATRPTMTLSTWDSKEASIEHLDDCDSTGKYDGKSPYLGYGDLSGPGPTCTVVWMQLDMPVLPQSGPPGIKLTASGASGGKYVFAQIVDSDFGSYTSPTPAGGGPAPPPAICGPHAGLDGAFPYAGVDPRSPWIAVDGPEMVLPAIYASGTRNFHASMYLMWQPDQLSETATASIPVPIGYQDWQFIATAFQKPPVGRGKWDKHPTLTASGDEGQGFVPSGPSDNSIYGYPLWSHLSSNDCGVSQEVR